MYDITDREEGDACGVDSCTGKMIFPPVENCSCHISPPCAACTNNPLTCDTCHREIAA